jgi:hypothetical protein
MPRMSCSFPYVASRQHSAADIDNYCLIYEPITWSEQDTQDTRDRIDRENGEFECTCNTECPKMPGTG